jgi:antitoxin (DNA-binding transcriptional repressor) of toxin-antitoxin stability system
MFAVDVREARTEFLLTLEAVYRGEDVPPANDGPLVS